MSLDFYLQYKCDGEEITVFDTNITHNLTNMADKSGIYEALWRPEKIKAEKSKDIITLLEKGLADLKKRPTYFKKFDSENGWGLYEHFVPFVEEVLKACKKYPNSKICVSR